MGDRPDIDLRCVDCRDPSFLVDADGAALVIADPPWVYDQRIGESAAEDHYDGIETPEVARLLGAFPGRKLALWLTWAVMQEWFDAVVELGPPERGDHVSVNRWTWGGARSGGAWSKSGEGDRGHYGQGKHWAGCCEPVLVYSRGRALPVLPEGEKIPALRNSWVSPPRGHSEKPIEWQRGWIRRWTLPGELVVDPFCGLGAVAVACVLEGRRYLGAELNPARCEAARQRIVLAQRRPLSAR